MKQQSRLSLSLQRIVLAADLLKGWEVEVSSLVNSYTYFKSQERFVGQKERHAAFFSHIKDKLILDRGNVRRTYC